MADESTSSAEAGDQARADRRSSSGLLVGAAALLIVMASCSHLGYYTQSLVGGAKVMSKRRPVAEVIADPATGERLRSQLELALEMRDFAVSELGLPDNGSYRRYSDLGRPYAVWNVVAAPELSVAPKTWCFLIVGCVAYRGYFSETKAERFAGKLRDHGYDVDVSGVEAYSTLGWFADPLLNTFIDRPEPYLAGLLFHELAHQRVMAKGDTAFNESFATTVEEEGAMRWLDAHGQQAEIDSYLAFKRREREFTELVFTYRERLDAIFATMESDDWKRDAKDRTLSELRSAYESMKRDWGGYAGYDPWFERELNNARLALVGVYHLWVPAFRELLDRQGGQLEPFYVEVEALASLGADERNDRLEALRAAAVEEAP